MFGFLKRLFGVVAQWARQQNVAPIESVKPVAVPPAIVPPPVATPSPAMRAPIAAAPVAATPTPPATLQWLPEPEPVSTMSGYEMIPSLGNPDAYMVGLVGEEHHAAAVEALQAGMAIWLQLEPDNPHDSSAIAAVDGRGRVIGYIAQESWLREAVYGAGAGFAARVLVVDTGSRGFREVVLEVMASEQPLRERRYRA